MGKLVELGNDVLLLHSDRVGVQDLTTFYVVAHGVQSQVQFGIDKKMTLYFPWGVGQFGWYESDTGFDLLDIMLNERRGHQQGRTTPTKKVTVGVPTVGSASKTPLLHYDASTTPEISLEAHDLNAAFCMKMLDTYYVNARAHHEVLRERAAGGPFFSSIEDIGILCLKEKTFFGGGISRNLSSVLAQLLPSLSRYTDVMVYCLCCSVKKGEERSGYIQAEGYVQM